MNNFSKAELIGRNKLKTVLDEINIQYEFTESPYEHYDVVTSRDGTTSGLTELKFRENYNSTDKCIAEEGSLLEKYKYDKLMATYNSNPAYNKCFYINIFKNNVMYIWDLTKITPQWYEKKYQKTTKGDRTKVTKIVADLKLDDAICWLKM